MIARFVSWIFRLIIRRVGAATLLSLLLLLSALFSVTFGLSEVIRGFDTGLMLIVITLGSLTGWILARTRLPGWLGTFIIVILGFEAILVRVGQLERLIGTLVAELAALVVAVWRWPRTGWPDVEPAWQALMALLLALDTLSTRLIDWLAAMTGDEPPFDLVAITIVWGLLLWLVAAWASWAVRRYRHPLMGLTPAGALLAVIFAYAPQHSAALVPVLGATLLLIGLVKYQTRENRWQRNSIDFPTDLRLDVSMAVLSLALSLVVVAWMAPSLSIRRIARTAYDLFGGRVAQAQPVADSLGIEPPSARPEPTLLETVRIGGLPRRHLLGTGPELSDQVALVITTNDEPPASADEPVPRYYWRSITYDTYSGHGWVTGPTQTIDYTAGQSTLYEEEFEVFGSTASSRWRILEQNVQVVENVKGLLYVAGELETTDQDFSVAWRAPEDAFAATIAASPYLARSRLPMFTEDQLRNASSIYPDHIRDRYLALPDTIPNRVLALARDLTATEPTPYDRARAIEIHLRTFPYTLDLPQPPADQDIVDYFLFDLQRGYCDYYATSMVVLARAAGLPARLAVGYINGTYDYEADRYVVSEAEAHSWVEIYFPGYGWVDFEPTGGRPGIERTGEAPTVDPAEFGTPADLGDASQTAEIGGGFRLWWLMLPGGGLMLLLLGVGSWLVADGWRLRRLPPAEAVAMLYRRLYQHGQRLDTPIEAGATPYEFATSLVGRVTGLGQNGRWAALFTPAPGEVRWLTDLYVQSLYSPHRPALADQTQAIQVWRRLQRRLWLAWLYLFSRRAPGGSSK